MRRQPSGARLVLLAFPRSFRIEYGDAVLQSISDMRRYGGLSKAGLVARVARDVMRTAPRMRLESVISRHRSPAIAAVLSGGVFAAVMPSPMVILLLVSAVALLALIGGTGEGPIVNDPSHFARWYRWMGGGVAMFVVGSVAAFIDGPELSTAGFVIWILSWACAAVCVVFGIILATSRALHRTVGDELVNRRAR